MNEIPVKSELEELKGMLERMVGCDNLTTSDVLNISRKIDELIVQCYSK